MTDWRKIEIGTYIDIENMEQIGENIFECWIKSEKGSYVFENTQRKYNIKIGYQLCKYLINCSSREFAIKGIILYSKDGQIIEQGNLNIMEVEWTQIPPDSLVNNILDIVTGKISYADLQNENNLMNPHGSFWLSVIIGFIITAILGIFVWRIKVDPFFTLVTIAYTIHPLFRYKFNYKEMKLKHNLLRRFIIMGLTMHCLFMFGFYTNTTTYNNIYQNFVTNIQEGRYYCTKIAKYNDPPPLSCIINYIENNRYDESKYKMLNKLKNIEQECHKYYSTSEYTNCIGKNLQNFDNK